MQATRFLSLLPLRQWITVLGGVLLLSGLLFWGLRLWQTPVQTSADSAPRTATPAVATAVDKWFAPGAVRMNVMVQGVLVRRDRAVALLSVNDAPAVPYSVGDSVLANVRVQAIDATGVVLARGAEVLHFPAPEIPQPPADLIVPVTETQ